MDERDNAVLRDIRREAELTNELLGKVLGVLEREFGRSECSPDAWLMERMGKNESVDT